MKIIIVLLGTFIAFSYSTLQAKPIEFNLDGFIGSTENLSNTASDCFPGSVCKQKSGIRISLPKPGGGSIAPFPDVVKRQQTQKTYHTQ